MQIFFVVLLMAWYIKIFDLTLSGLAFSVGSPGPKGGREGRLRGPDAKNQG